MPRSSRRDAIFVSILSLEKLLAADDDALARLAAFVKAKPVTDAAPSARKYRLACNVMRAIKRN